MLKVCQILNKITAGINRAHPSNTVVICLFLSILTTKGNAQTWNGSGPDNNWTTTANWGTGTPLNNGTATTTMAGSTRLAAIVNTPWSIAQLRFATGAGAFTLSGNTITIGTGGITSSASNTQSISNSIILGSSQAWISTAGNLNTTGAIDLGSNTLTITPSTSRTITLSNIVSGTGNIIKNGTGTLSLTGATTLQNINLSNTSTSRTLTVTGANDLRIQGIIANGSTSTAGAITKTGSGRLVLAGANTYGGATTISSGTLEATSNTALGTTTGTTTIGSGGTLALSNNITTGEAVAAAGTGLEEAAPY